MKIKDIIIGVLLIVVLLFFFKDPSIDYAEKIIIKTDTVTVVDTLYKEVKITTKVDKIQLDTVYIKDTDTINVYRNPIGLQYGTANIITHSTGIIKEQYVELDFLLPEITKTKYVTVESILPYRQHSLYLGLGTKIGINDFDPSFALGASIGYKSHLLQYHYDINNTHWVTYHRQFELKLPLWKKRFNF
jgi:hypothetical protein